MKIMIFGLSGIHHLDRYYFVENWAPRQKEEFTHMQNALVPKGEWIIEGNSTKTFEVRYCKTDIAIYFCFNRWLCLWRVIKLMLFPNHNLKDSLEGYSKGIGYHLIEYLWNFEKEKNPQIEALRKRYPDILFYLVKNDREAETLAEMLREEFGKSEHVDGLLAAEEAR